MTIQEYVERGRKAVEAIKDYDQAQTDKLVYEAAKIIYQHAAELAREAVDETGLGYYEDKICKNTDTPAAFWAYLRDKKSVGIIRMSASSPPEVPLQSLKISLRSVQSMASMPLLPVRKRCIRGILLRLSPTN